jgi:acetyl-CoA synthetase
MWQTATGGILITPLPAPLHLKPFSTFPFPGVSPNPQRRRLSCRNEMRAATGNQQPWPGLMRKVYGDPERFKNTYFVATPAFQTGDGARRDVVVSTG